MCAQLSFSVKNRLEFESNVDDVTMASANWAKTAKMCGQRGSESPFSRATQLKSRASDIDSHQMELSSHCIFDTRRLYESRRQVMKVDEKPNLIVTSNSCMKSTMGMTDYPRMATRRAGGVTIRSISGGRAWTTCFDTEYLHKMQSVGKWLARFVFV